MQLAITCMQVIAEIAQNCTKPHKHWLERHAETAQSCILTAFFEITSMQWYAEITQR
ncbi:hypothetical protein L8R84_27735 [Vibrio splendidus]|uniref:hypothetical protein n=1 Tax=Vibrio TaxID=662 RepID=UPI0024682644|nr:MULTISPECIES: hypothetical protein [Vibrio]MDH5939862.1 hypothetical protein [Vibrio splendidus]MDH5967711.1 hypothetical protein [Vibrio aestuarianus]CAK1711150.1 hypothetical protein VCRA2113O213_1180001 [Vibrio crassostreae]